MLSRSLARANRTRVVIHWPNALVELHGSMERSFRLVSNNVACEQGRASIANDVQNFMFVLHIAQWAHWLAELLVFSTEHVDRADRLQPLLLLQQTVGPYPYRNTVGTTCGMNKANIRSRTVQKAVLLDA